MLASLTVRSVRLLTNNPRKHEALTRLGITVSERVPHVIAANEHNRFYLATKATRSGHLLAAGLAAGLGAGLEGALAPRPRLPEQDDTVLVADDAAAPPND